MERNQNRMCNSTLICKSCGKEVKNLIALGVHISKENKEGNHISTREYYLKYIAKNPDENICKNPKCKNEVEFFSLGRGFRKYCSIKCRCEDEEYWKSYKEGMIKNHGVDSPLKSEELKEKFKNTCIKHYGCDNPFKSDIIKSKHKQTMVNRYGVDHPSKIPEIRERLKSLLDSVRPQSRISFKNKYGVDFPYQIKGIRDKIKTTCIKKYGVDNPFKLKSMQSKVKDTCLLKYGVDHISKSDRKKETIRKKYFNNLLNSDRLKNLVTPNFNSELYDGIEKKYSWKCIKCGNIFEDHLDNGKIPRCKVCFPILNGSSNLEKEVYEFVSQNCPDSISNTRSIIPNNYELDIFIPSKNLAIEFNGLYWHSEISGNKNKDYHLNKTLQCQERGIQLIHIFEDEWLNKQEIVKSIIRSKLNLITNKIPARKCTIKSVNKEEAFNFLDSNHLQGYINGTHLGLYYNNELVSILTYGKPRFNSKYEMEILRFCNKINTIVIGGLSKLLSKINNSSIITYVDRRFGTGNSYNNCNFVKTGESSPSYYYTNNNYSIRYNRLQFQKHLLESKLESFDSNLTEWQNMQLSGYDRIWDCGNIIYSKESI